MPKIVYVVNIISNLTFFVSQSNIHIDNLIALVFDGINVNVGHVSGVIKLLEPIKKTL